LSDTIGRINVPGPVSSGLTFPLSPDLGYGFLQQGGEVIEHRFGSGATLQVQSFFTGFGARQFDLRIHQLSYAERTTLINFYQDTQGSFQTFIYNAPAPGTSATTSYTVMFKTAPLILDHSANMSSAKLTFVEIISTASAPSYSISATDTRFPGTALTAALLQETQQLIPLIHIQVRDPAVPQIYLSDRRCLIGGQLYLPRVLDIGEAGSSVIMSQSWDPAGLQPTLFPLLWATPTAPCPRSSATPPCNSPRSTYASTTSSPKSCSNSGRAP
jgi:hypothetical protein